MENRFFLNSDISDVKVVCEDLGHVRKDGGILSNTAGIKTLIWIILRCYFKNVLHFFIWNVTFFLSLSSIYNTVASCGPVGSMWPRVKRIRLVIRGSQVRIPLWLWCSSIKKKKKKILIFQVVLTKPTVSQGQGYKLGPNFVVLYSEQWSWIIRN